MLSYRHFNYLIESKIDIDGHTHKFVVDPMYDDEHTTLKSIPTHKIEQSFKNDIHYYVSKSGENSKQSKHRYEGFKEFLRSKPKEVHASSLHIHDDGKVSFNNGRHRYAVMRDAGVSHIPVSLSKESLKNAKQHGYV